MLQLVVLGIGIWVGLLVNRLANQDLDVARLYQSQTRQARVVALAESLEQYVNETGVFPASTAVLTATTGFEHARSEVDNWQGYGVSPAINDGVWIFNRMVLFSNDPTSGVTTAAYLAANSCGTGGYTTAASWCGTKTSNWFRRETRERYNNLILTQRSRMNRLLQKFADYYNLNKKFPDKDQLNVALGADSITSLATLAGYAGAANACSSQFSYMGVPIDCGEMFDLWGGPIGYEFVSKQHIMLVSESPIFNNTGNRVVVTADLNVM